MGRWVVGGWIKLEINCNLSRALLSGEGCREVHR